MFPFSNSSYLGARIYNGHLSIIFDVMNAYVTSKVFTVKYYVAAIAKTKRNEI